MSPSTALQDPIVDDPHVLEDELAAVEAVARRKHDDEIVVAGEKEEDEDEEDEEDEDDDDEDDEEDDEVETDEEGYERTPVSDPVASSGPLDTSNRVGDTNAETHAAPDVSSDRVPSTDAEPEGSLDCVKSAPLGIQQIEDLEHDAKGG
jgi:hypothetical protein